MSGRPRGRGRGAGVRAGAGLARERRRAQSRGAEARARGGRRGRARRPAREGGSPAALRRRRPPARPPARVLGERADGRTGERAAHVLPGSHLRGPARRAGGRGAASAAAQARRPRLGRARSGRRGGLTARRLRGSLGGPRGGAGAGHAGCPPGGDRPCPWPSPRPRPLCARGVGEAGRAARSGVASVRALGFRIWSEPRKTDVGGVGGKDRTREEMQQRGRAAGSGSGFVVRKLFFFKLSVDKY